MAQQKKGFIARFLEGKERSEEYARSTLPTNRWQLFWDIFKGNFGKLVKINLLMLLFFIPLIVVVVLGSLYSDSIGITYPFAANLAIGYPAMPALQGVSEWLKLQSDLYMYFGILLTSILAAVGLSGGMYVVRNMVWTEGVFVANDFWKGVKLNFKNALQTALFFTTILLVTASLINFSSFVTASSSALDKTQGVMLKISIVISYGFMALAAMMSLWMIALGVNYKMGFFALLRNSFLMSIGTIPQTLFFGAIALIPFILILFNSTFFTLVAVMMILLFALSYLLLVWLDFAQWVFDKFLNPKIEGAKVGRGIYNKDGTSALVGGESGASIEYQRMLLSHGRSRLVARPIKPIDDSMSVYELPQSFTREDLKKLRESKDLIMEETEAYAEEHKNDLRYVEYNRQFDERERAIQEEDAKKAKGRKKLKPMQPPKNEN